MRCSSPTCECNMCGNCGESHSNCVCELIEDTQALLNKDDYTYEDFAHSARYLLERWIATKA